MKNSLIAKQKDIQSEPEKMATIDIETIKKEALEIIENSYKKITPPELAKNISQKYSIKRGEIKSVIKLLITEGHIAYTYHYGRTFIEKSFNRAVRISKYVILKPPGIFFKPEKDDVVIEIGHGVSFGTGQHPTTRLAIRGIEYALRETDLLKGNKETNVLDIGTGSGVLAITALRLGIKKAIGLDLDPCARYEAKENARFNRLEDSFEINDLPLENFNNRFTLITANLRYPTLKKIYSKVIKLTGEESAVVLSGIKREEVSDLIDLYTKKCFECRWKESEKDWGGLVFCNSPATKAQRHKEGI